MKHFSYLCPANDAKRSTGVSRTHFAEDIEPGTLHFAEDIEPGTLHFAEDIEPGTLHSGE